MACRLSSVLLDVMQSLEMTEVWITENSKKIYVYGKIVKNVVYFPGLKWVLRVIYWLFIQKASILSVQYSQGGYFNLDDESQDLI